MPYHPKKPYHLCRKSVAPDPLVDPGNPPHRHQARPPARSARPHHRMVVVAACPPGPSSSCPSQACIPHKKNATVMLSRGTEWLLIKLKILRIMLIPLRQEKSVPSLLRC